MVQIQTTQMSSALSFCFSLHFIALFMCGTEQIRDKDSESK